MKVISTWFSRIISVSFLILFLMTGQVVLAQLPSFPGAEGAGMYTSGGRGTVASPTTVFEVTNLSDDGLPGSLRYAVNTTATYRTIVFRVSGTIHLNAKLNIKANTTVAGQTAPGDGICIADYPVVISGDNVIVRYMRFRLGDKNQLKTSPAGCGVPVAPFTSACMPLDGSGGDDALGNLGNKNLIIDHCSVSWSNDEALTVYRGDSVTLQWNIISEPLDYSYHFETGDTDFEHHGYGGIWGSKKGTMHHNLFAHARNRNPRFAGISTYSPNTIGVENCDFRNNVIYNWGINTVYGGEGGNYNVVNNYYKYGPSTSSGVRYRICNPSFSATVPYGKWYVDGNYVDGSTVNSTNNWTGVVPQGGVADTTVVKAASFFDLGFPVTTQSPLQAYEEVLQKAGCSLPFRDTLDQRIVNDVRNRTGRIIDVQGGYVHGTPYANTVTAWPSLGSVAAPTDTDHDGMPDDWENTNGLNPADPSDRNGIAANGYTNLENYLNSLASGTVSSTPGIYVSGSLNAFSQVMGSPSPSQTYTVSGANLTADITITAPASFEISADGTAWSTSLNFSPVSGTVTPVIIYVRLNAAAEGSHSGNIQHSSTGANSINLPVSGNTSAATGIGNYADLDGGFERQDPGSFSTATSHTSTTKWEASAAYSIVSSDARTGANYFHFNQSSSSNKYIFSPVLTNPALPQNTPYVIQFWYRSPAPQASTTNTSLYGWSTVTGQLGGSNITLTTNAAVLNSTTPAGNWIFFSGTLNTPNLTPTSTYAGMKVTAPQSPYFDIDDYVIYPGTAVDDTPPASVGNLITDGASLAGKILLTWSAPAGGTDEGGYIVVRSAANTAPLPNEKGVYIAGNTMGAGYDVVYAGKDTSYADGNVTAGNTYYYYVFTVDKAYNFAVPVQAAGSVGTATPSLFFTGSLYGFTQTAGSPSSVQNITVKGNNLNADVSVTAPSGYEISEDGNTWTGTITVSPVNNSLQASISIRLNAGSAGVYNGVITASGGGASDATIAVNGITNSSSVIPPGIDAVVAKDGSGNYTSIQAAVNAAPTGRSTPYRIFIKKGKYVETVNIPSNRPFLQFIGESMAETILSYDNYSGKPNPAGGTYGTSTSGTLIINAPDIMMMNLSVENATAYGINANAVPPAPGDGPQAVAVYTTSDRVVFYNCRFNGGQDTYYGGNVKGTRSYLKNCYIDGNTDFMFGSSTVIFDTCVIYPRTRLDNGNGGYLTAVNTKAESGYGYVFRDCRITTNRGATFYTLGRPWQNDGNTADASKSHNKVAFLNTRMGTTIKPEGWSVWDAGTNTSFITYVEYNTMNYDGSPANISGRVAWSQQLNFTDAQKYYNNDTIFINADSPVMTNWNPYAVWPELSGTFKPELSVSNFIGKKSAASATLTWNLSWPLTNVSCDLYRSTDKVNFTLINTQISSEDTAGNFSFTDNLPPAGQTYYYIIRTSRTGYSPATSDTANISSTPTITALAALGSFLQGLGTPSREQAFITSGKNIIDSIQVIPPDGYEISADGGTNWFNNTNRLSLYPSGGNVANTTLSVRLNAGSAGNYSGDIILASYLADTVRIPVTGTVQTDPLPVLVVLQQWPMTQNNQDSAAIRSPGVMASVSSFSRFAVSDGITVASVPAYSATRGQAFAATADGFWNTGSGGPGGNLSRNHYEQFTVTAASNYSVRVDSILLNTAFYNSSSNTKLAVVYSLSGFTTDSVDLSGASFASPVILPNQTGGPAFYSSLALNGAAGITIQAGETVSFRLYYSCGSSSAGRYAQLKDVTIIGLVKSTLPPSIAVSGTLNAFNQTVGSPSAVQTYTVSGSNLNGDISLSAPVNYQVSADGGASWHGSSSPFVLPAVSETVGTTTISVRLNAGAAGSYAGDILHISDGADTVKLSVNGTTVNAPAITVNGTLNPFTQIIGSPSGAQSYTVSGLNLTGNVVVKFPAGFELSNTNGTSWLNDSAILPVTSGTLATTSLLVRLNAQATGSYAGNITHSGPGTPTVILPVSGSTVPKPTVNVTASFGTFLHTLGTPSPAQNYTVAGNNLLGNITIIPPLRYELSVDGGRNWTKSPVTLVPVGGTAGPVTVGVRLYGVVPGIYSGSIKHATAGGDSIWTAVAGFTKSYIQEDYGIYPVPASRVAFLVHPDLAKQAMMDIYSLSGQRIFTQVILPSTYQTAINVEKMKQGIYIVVINTEDGKKVLRLIKQ